MEYSVAGFAVISKLMSNASAAASKAGPRFAEVAGSVSLRGPGTFGFLILAFLIFGFLIFDSVILDLLIFDFLILALFPVLEFIPFSAYSLFSACSSARTTASASASRMSGSRR